MSGHQENSPCSDRPASSDRLKATEAVDGLAVILLIALALTLLQARCARRVNSNGMYAAPPARFAYSSSAAAVGPPARSGPGMASLFRNRSPRFRLNLLIALLLSDFPHKNGTDGLTATKAIAAAANKSAPAPAKRTAENKRFRLNECGVFIFW
jgi:hypothetical protein